MCFLTLLVNNAHAYILQPLTLFNKALYLNRSCAFKYHSCFHEVIAHIGI